VKIRTPNDLFRKIFAFYKRNKDKEKVEWDHINTYHNMWEAPPTIVHLNQPLNDGGGMDFQTELWNLIKPILQEWTGQRLSPVSLYGIRIYHNNSILAPHVDRMPLVASCISKYL
jgi:prolyl 4-hydroxylase